RCPCSSFFFFSSRRRHTRFSRDWSSDVCSSDLAGSAAYLTGRAMARTWQADLQLAVYIVLLAAATRFIHFALFKGTLLSLHYYRSEERRVGKEGRSCGPRCVSERESGVRGIRTR